MSEIPGPARSGFTCTCCADHHAGPPLNYTATAPVVWEDALADDSDSGLTSDQCVVEQRTGITWQRVHEIAEALTGPGA